MQTGKRSRPGLTEGHQGITARVSWWQIVTGAGLHIPLDNT